MAERRTIGQILMSFGRITEDDVAEAIEHQQEHGGYFGEALLALGLVSQDELEWGLASQFDLPYVFPDAESIDPGAASLVTPEWALAHLTLPIMETGESLTVVVDSPIKTDAVDELQARTDKEIQLALASPAKIRELIRQVYARGAAQESDEPLVPVKLQEVFALALDAASARFGISSRGHRAWAWYDDSGRIRRRPLDGLWESELRELVSPSPAEEIDEVTRRKTWSAHVNREGVVHPVEVRYMGDESGAEFLFRPGQERSVLRERFHPPSQGVLSEVRMLARSGSARFVVTAEPEELGHQILPHLPTLLLDPSWRSIYVTDEVQAAADEAFSIELPTEDRDAWQEEFEALRPFHFDVVTVDLPGTPSRWVHPALDIASVAFLLWDPEEDRRVAHDAGIRWELKVQEADQERLEWILEPLRG